MGLKRILFVISLVALILSLGILRVIANQDVPTNEKPIPNFQGDVIYQVIVDRFYDGDPNNNFEPLYDPTQQNWKMYWGGDLRGIIEKVPYLKNMGITAVWLSPVNDNLNSFSTENNTGYHGYWTRDFFSIEEHFGDWDDFEELVDVLHSNGMKIVIDFVPNHATPIKLNDPNFAESGSLYKNGQLLGSYFNDYNGYFLHNGDIENWDDRFEAQFKNFSDPEGFSLAGLSHQHPTIDRYLKDAAKLFLERGVDGIRLDAVKHFPSGWQKSFADEMYSEYTPFIFGEWYGDTPGTQNHLEKIRYTKHTGISVIDFDLYEAITNVFGYDQSMSVLEQRVEYIQTHYKYPHHLVTFIDNHDVRRFLTVNPDHNRLHQALAFILTAPGIPSIYYGTEQYLHNDTNGGGDPYNRPMMQSFNENTVAFQLISTLSHLRQNNKAIQVGGFRERWLNDDVLIFERKFHNDVVLVAINKSSHRSYSITGLLTDLPDGQYDDYLNELLSGNTIQVSNGAVYAFDLKPNSVSVWVSSSPADYPQLGSITPYMEREGNVVSLIGQGFGENGAVTFGGVLGEVLNWTDEHILVRVPNIQSGTVDVEVHTHNGTSESHSFEVLTDKQVSLVFKVRNVPETAWGEQVYVTGNIPELGNWSTNPDDYITPMWAPHYPEWFGIYSVPANTQIEFKFFIKRNDGSVTWESGPNRIAITPEEGTGDIVVDWQY